VTSTRDELAIRTHVAIRPMAAVDVAPSADLLRRGDFGEREAFFAWALTQPTITAFVAAREGVILGTGVASTHGRVGWVGVIFVAQDERGSGLGRRITRSVVDHLETNGCRTQILIASTMGRPMYELEGFAVLDQQIRFSIDGLPAVPTTELDPRIRPIRPSELAAVIALDEYATGEDRGPVLRTLVTPESTLVALAPSGEVSGFLTRAPWRGGALIAPDPDDALRLLEARRHATGVSGRAGAGVLSRNAIGRERLRSAGWVEELGGVRMIRGEPLDWHPNAIWGQFNGALG
jgi:GNAT superfamily N-acetyltransferase